MQNQGFDASTELDQRDALVNKIADVVGIKRSDFFSGQLNLIIGNSSIQQGSNSNQFTVNQSDDGTLGVILDDSDRHADLGGGRLDALLEVYNSTIPKYTDKLDQLAQGLIQSVDAAHATGVGTAGSFQSLSGSREVGDADVPLNQATTALPIESGELTISIVDSDGTRRTEVIQIDPATDSLEDIATKLSAIDGLNGKVNTNSRQLQMFADEGLKFDFTGSLPTHPELDSFHWHESAEVFRPLHRHCKRPTELSHRRHR